MKILHVVGARPNFMKAAPLYQACAKRKMAQVIVHTGQHFNERMSAVFFKDLALPPPDINLEVGSGSHAEQTSAVMNRIEKVIIKVCPDWVLVYGDVNSTMAAALVCSKLSVSVAHVEAGLRSFDRRMPEEINRILTDQISDLLFTPSEDGNINLIREGILPDKIKLVGNIMIDTLVKQLPFARSLPRDKYPDAYALVTLHRPSNVDDKEVLSLILKALLSVSYKLPIIFPIHPRTKKQVAAMEILKNSHVHLIEPLGYLEFLSLEQHAAVIITDSGGIQEESTFLNVPCLTLRENTERPVTVNMGTNKLIGTDYARLEQEVNEILAGNGKKGHVPPLWDGKTGERISDILMQNE